MNVPLRPILSRCLTQAQFHPESRDTLAPLRSVHGRHDERTRERQRIALSLVFILLAGPSACDKPSQSREAVSIPKRQSPYPPAPFPPLRAGISELEPGATLPTAAGQSIYVPITTRATVEDGRAIRLTVNVAVRNTDESRSILVTLLRHRDADGQTVRDYLRAPARLAPKATLDVVIKDTDNIGPATSLLVEWVADRPVAPPIVDAIMLSTTGSQGIAFTSVGQVIEDRLHPAPPR